MTVTINNIKYAIITEYSTESIKETYPNLYKFDTENGTIRTLYIRRPNGRKQFMVTESVKGFSTLTTIK